MKDIPIFETPYGVASLMLTEIPYRGTAYIQVQSMSGDDPTALLSECATFCRMAGADKVYSNVGRGEPDSVMLRMVGCAWVDKEKLENLFPVTEATVERWRKLYNEKMASLPHAATLTAADEKRILETGGAYFVHHEGELLGIGWLEDTKLLAIAAVKPGAGERVAHTLMSMVEGADMTIEVLSTNERAIRLYERLGFLKTGEVLRWYAVKK